MVIGRDVLEKHSACSLGGGWRRGQELNLSPRLCKHMPDRSATAPESNLLMTHHIEVRLRVSLSNLTRSQRPKTAGRRPASADRSEVALRTLPGGTARDRMSLPGRC